VNSVSALADDQAADHRVAERAGGFPIPFPWPSIQRYATEHRGHRRHHDRTEPQDGRLPDRLFGRHMLVALGRDCEVEPS